MRQLLAQPGYIRLEKPLLRYNALYWLAAVIIGVFALLLWRVHHKRSHRKRRV